LTPPIDVEKRYLAILTKGQPFEEQFSSAVFRFTDGTEEEIRKAASQDNSPASGHPNGVFDDIRQQLKKKLKDNLDLRLLQDLLDSGQAGKFTAFVKGKKYGDKMVYDVDPQGAGLVKPEEVSLFQCDDNHEGIWAAFHLSKEYAAGTANSDEQNDPVSISHQKLDVSIGKNARLSGTAETTFTRCETESVWFLLTCFLPCESSR
jgi:hypothetical protein